MSEKICTLIIIAIVLFGTVAIVNPVQGHFTLGGLTGAYRYHVNDFDPHIPGVIGYVWPGGGQNAYSGFPGFANVNNAPGYQSPYPGGKPGLSPGAVGNAPSSSWYQLEGDAYAPFGAVLTGSTGDLIFALNATQCAVRAQSKTVCPTLYRGNWDTVAILIPPGFSIPNSPGVVSTTITNDYSGIIVSRIGPYDRYAPGWTMIGVMSDLGSNAATPTGSFYYSHQAIKFTDAGEWYYVRINGVVAPSVAGRYFFKILLYGSSSALCGEEGTGTGAGALNTESCSQFIPTENWPVLLVKGEIDPAIITGTIRYAGYNQTLYSKPIQEAGRVYAKMTTKLDPYTGQTRPDLPLTDAVAYFNATAQGHYEVEGLGPGVYDLYASAAGYPQTIIASRVTVLKGQSLHFDGYLQPGPVIHGNVYTKHQFGDEPWPDASGGKISSTATGVNAAPKGTYIKIELYDGPTLNHIPDSKANMVSWSPVPCIAGGQQDFFGRQNAGSCGAPRLGGQIAFPWHEYTGNLGFQNGYGTTGFLSGASGPYCVTTTSGASLATSLGFNQVSTGANAGTHAGCRTSDPQGVGPPQNWYVQGGTTIPFHFEFGVKGEYGAPRDLDGMVPQMYATWVNGLTPGRYYARAWVFRYVQSALDGSTFQEYYFDITPNEWAGDVTLPIDLRLSSWVNKTVHFHNVINGITEDPIDTGAGMMSGVLVDANGIVWSYNQTLLGYKDKYTKGAKSDWGAGAFSSSTTVRSRNDLDKGKLNAYAVETGRANIQFWGWNDTWGGENYGIPSGTYQPHVYALGYIEKGPAEQVSVTLSGNPTSVSDHMYRGASFNITVFSIDWQRPRVSRNWIWGNPVGYTASGLATTKGSGFTGDSRSLMVGEEIDIGIFRNGTLVDFIGDEPSILPDTVLTSCLFQSQTNSSVQMCGGGWDAQYRQPTGTYINYQGNSNDAYFGQELSSSKAGCVGGEIYGFLYFETETVLFGPAHYYPSKLRDGGTYSLAVVGSMIHLYPSAIPPGQYDFRGYTYGYIQDKSFSAIATAGQVADIKINLIIGVNVTMDILFKKEHIITPTSANMSTRVRLFDDSGNLVAEWMSSEGTYLTSSGFARAADGTDRYPFGPLQPAIPKPLPLNTYNYLPGGVTLLHVMMAGLPQVPAGGTDNGIPLWYPRSSIPQQSYPTDPVFATASCRGFAVGCFETLSASLLVQVPDFFPNTGIRGAPIYQGGWTAEVDFVNWYGNNTKNGISSIIPNYFPPVQGLLMGESYHVIPATTSKSGISLTEDLATSKTGLGTMVPNHLGPYAQQGVWHISNAHLSGEASGVFEVDLNGLVSGNALAFTWSNEFRPLSWGLVNVAGAKSGTRWNFYTYDGVYQAYLPPGTYKFTISSPGIVAQTMTVAVSSGMTGSGVNAYLEQTNIPIPEFSTITITAFSALTASLYVTRRKRRQ